MIQKKGGCRRTRDRPGELKWNIGSGWSKKPQGEWGLKCDRNNSTLLSRHGKSMSRLLKLCKVVRSFLRKNRWTYLDYFFFFRHSRFPWSFIRKWKPSSSRWTIVFRSFVESFNTRIESLENTSKIETIAFKGKNYNILEMLNLSFFRDGDRIMEKPDKSW